MKTGMLAFSASSLTSACLLYTSHTDRHAGYVLLVGVVDREAGDVVAAPGEEAGDPSQNACAVLDHSRYGMQPLGWLSLIHI